MMPITRPEQVNFLNNLMFINKTPLIVEIAQTEYQRAMGLQFRSELPSGHGMLFIFDEPQDVSFHMRNVSFPIDMLFLDSASKIMKVYTAKPGEDKIECKNVVFVIEAPAGWTKENKITKGMIADFPVQDQF